MGDVVLAASEIIVDAQDVVALSHQLLAEMRADKSGTAGHEHTLSRQ
jgi:hypothetical protein